MSIIRVQDDSRLLKAQELPYPGLPLLNEIGTKGHLLGRPGHFLEGLFEFGAQRIFHMTPERLACFFDMVDEVRCGTFGRRLQSL